MINDIIYEPHRNSFLEKPYEHTISCKYANFLVIQFKGEFVDYISKEKTNCNLGLKAFKECLKKSNEDWHNLYADICICFFSSVDNVCLLISKNLVDNHLNGFVDKVELKAKALNKNMKVVHNMANIFQFPCFKELPSDSYTKFKINEDFLVDMKVLTLDKL